MPATRKAVLILNPARPDHTHTSHRRALRMIAAGVASWDIPGVSVRLVAAREHVAVPVAVWSPGWRQTEAAVLQPYSPYERLTGIGG
jgi:hypothetical protein